MIKTIGIIGLGGIGAEMARMAAGIGMNVIAYSRTPKPELGIKQVDIDTLLKVYQQPDPHTLLVVMSEPRKVTESISSAQ